MIPFALVCLFVCDGAPIVLLVSQLCAARLARVKQNNNFSVSFLAAPHQASGHQSSVRKTVNLPEKGKLS